MEQDHATSMQASNSAVAEATRPGYVIAPAVDIFETQEALGVLADMPGVRATDLKIDLNEGVLTITGHVHAPESEHEADVIREFRHGTFQRKFTLSESIDQTKIEAKLVEGVLRLRLPKVARAQVKKIEIKSS